MKTKLASSSFLILTLALSTRVFVPAALAQAPVPDDFNPGIASFIYPPGYVTSVGLHTGGRIMVTGSFTSLGDQSRVSIGRLSVDGIVDSQFNMGVGGSFVKIMCFAVQPDGKVVVGGAFDTLGGQSHVNIGRLNADGTVDTGFNPGADRGNPHAEVDALAIQPDGKILVAGSFTKLAGEYRYFEWCPPA
jgi:uncharacterized delta-60 repeat protein